MHVHVLYAYIHAHIHDKYNLLRLTPTCEPPSLGPLGFPTPQQNKRARLLRLLGNHFLHSLGHQRKRSLPLGLAIDDTVLAGLILDGSFGFSW